MTDAKFETMIDNIADARVAFLGAVQLELAYLKSGNEHGPDLEFLQDRTWEAKEQYIKSATDFLDRIKQSIIL